MHICMYLCVHEIYVAHICAECTSGEYMFDAYTIAGCFVTSGTVTRNTKIRLLRDGVVVHTGSLGSLKRFKDDMKEVKKGYECGLNIENFNDIKADDIIEGYEQVEVKQTL